MAHAMYPGMSSTHVAWQQGVAYQESDLLLMFALLILDFSFELLDSSTGDAFPLYGGLCFQIMLLNPLNILRLHQHKAANSSVNKNFSCAAMG